ncbi:DUF5710 domain-containing protein [Actinosynnema sp. ALI-1.44]|uniref:DUF5710 domain-containing protein n=1 Tax=Actinosynnema sp. ALI-1.44 TaxID=1933779 RepID=UPI00192CFC25|nr:DUF5710 domain-containing protein [Actinosynnema sp. ALI-1.44]
MSERIWLDVPFGEKEEAKSAGARWDPSAKRWYAPHAGMTALNRWTALPEIPALLPGEDRTFGAGLHVDLVPSSCWFTNVRYCIAPRDWERLRRTLTSRANHRCEICGRAEDREAQRWLEAHERWSYDSATWTQKLVRLICLCTDCHRTTHFGLAQIKGHADAAFKHLCAVTGMTDSQARQHIDRAFAIWRDRSTQNWHLDLSMITNAGITLATPPAANQRPGIAETRLRR